jgi:prepilin-type N-terminal cleavage/methylation domain-containing protein
MKPALHSLKARRRGFTLIELLVVVTIIALLAAGAYGAYSVMIEKGKQTGAKTAIQTVINAVSQFEMDYDRKPLPTSATKGTDCVTDTSGAENLITVLKGVDPEQNPKETDYLGEIKDAKLLGTQSESKRVDGIYRETEDQIALYDPWGSVYKITLDLDGDKKVENPDQSDAEGNLVLHKPVIMFSWGKDLEESTWKDNVASWKN